MTPPRGRRSGGPVPVCAVDRAAVKVSEEVEVGVNVGVLQGKGATSARGGGESLDVDTGVSVPAVAPARQESQVGATVAQGGSRDRIE